MNQFSVCRARVGSGVRLVVVMQHDSLDGLRTVLVAPLMPLGELQPLGRVRPVVDWQGREYVIVIDQMAPLLAEQLGRPIGVLSEHRFVIVRAIDALICGP